MFKLNKNNYDNSFILYFLLLLFLSIIWCSICEKSETISFGPCNIMIAEQKYRCNIIDLKQI